MKKSLERAIAKRTGLSIESLRRMTPHDLRERVEKKKGRGLVFTCSFPFIGRGNVMREKTVSHEQIEKQLDEALR